MKPGAIEPVNGTSFATPRFLTAEFTAVMANAIEARKQAGLKPLTPDKLRQVIHKVHQPPEGARHYMDIDIATFDVQAFLKEVLKAN